MFVACAIDFGQIAFFVPDTDEDVDGHADGEDEMSYGHGGCGPEGDEEPEIEGVADYFVEEGRAEAEIASSLIREMCVCLGQAEEMKVIDQEGTEQDDAPADEGDAQENVTARAVEGPDDGWQRLPKQEEKDEYGAGNEDIGASFDGLGYEAGPSFFKCRSCHYAVLHSEKSDEEKIDQDAERCGETFCGSDVHRFGNEEVGHETDQI